MYVTNMLVLEQELGKILRTKEVAQYLRLDEKTVMSHYKKLGGMRLGRRYVFSEKELINAIQKRTEMECPGAKQWETERETIQHKEGSCGVVSRNEKKTRRRVGREEDPFNLLN